MSSDFQIPAHRRRVDRVVHFFGPTGVGKTELEDAGRARFSEQNIVRIDTILDTMLEFLQTGIVSTTQLSVAI